MSAQSATAANALATESRRRWPPTTTVRGFPVVDKYAGGVDARSAGSATARSVTSGLDAMALTLCAKIGRPASASNCFGTDAPKRDPRPPAGIMAETCIRAMLPGLPIPSLALQVFADVFDGLPHLAAGLANPFADIALRFVGGPFG